MTVRVRRRGETTAFTLAGLLIVTGVLHFGAPDSFDRLIPAVLPGSRRGWTYASGAIEIGLAIGIVWRTSRRVAATLTAVFLVLIFPANIKMAVDSASGSTISFVIASLRLPLQLPLIWWAWRVRTQSAAPAP